MWSFILALVLSSNSEDGRWERKPVMHKHTLSSNVSGTCSNKRTQMLHARARKKKTRKKGCQTNLRSLCLAHALDHASTRTERDLNKHIFVSLRSSV